MKKIFIIEDDAVLARGLCRALTSDTNAAQAFGTIKEARAALSAEKIDLMILDVNLPDGSGFDFLGEVKAIYDIPVIMLTANDMETDIVAALERGADDYITKPFSLAVLRARANTQLRRTSGKPLSYEKIEKYSFDFTRMEFSVDGVTVELSKTEQKLLRLLIENIGITLSRSVLIDRIWTDGAEYVDENALSVTVNRLRTKLYAQEYIKTVYGIGYVWVKKDE